MSEYKAFLDKVDEVGALDEFAEETYGYDAHEVVATIDTSDDEIELTRVDVMQLTVGLISGHNKANDNGDFFEAAMQHRLLNKVLQIDDDVREDFEEAQQPRDVVGEVLGPLGEL